jgi:rhamnose transport system permease protein
MKFLSGREVIPALLCVIAFTFGAVTTHNFLDVRFLVAHTSLYIETGFLAIGMTLVIICGEIDLSVASTLSLVACASAIAIKDGVSPIVAMGLGIVLGAALGAFNGVLVARLRLPSFVVTLGTMAAYRGVSQILLKSTSIELPFTNGADHNFLIPFGIALVVVGLVLHKTVLGRWIYAVGTNERAAFFAGIPTQRVTITVFVISGILAGVAGLVMNERLGVARFDHGLGLELDAITAVVLGGASIYGGVGSIAGTFLALLLLGIVRTQMGLADVTSEYQLAAIGSLLVISVILGNLYTKISSVFRVRKVSSAPIGGAI